MNKGFWSGAVLLGLLCALPASSIGAATGRNTPDLAAMPADLVAFVTVHPARLAAKLGIKESSAFSWLADWKSTFGLPLTSVARCTILLKANEEEPKAYLLLVRTIRPCNRSAILRACLANPTEVTPHCHVDRDGGAVYFLDDHTFLMGEKQSTVVWYLKEIEGRPAARQGNWLDSPHDFLAWSRTTTNPWRATLPTASTTFGPVPVEAVPVVANKLRAAPPSEHEESTPVSLALVPVPLPEGVESAQLTIDCGDEVDVRVRLSCTDQEAARNASRCLRALVDFGRSALLAVTSEVEWSKLFHEPADKGSPRLPTLLLRKMEKALQRVHIRAEGTAVPLQVRLAVPAKTLRKEAARWNRVLKTDSGSGWSLDLRRWMEAASLPITANGPPPEPLPAPVPADDAVLPPPPEPVPPPPVPPPPGLPDLPPPSPDNSVKLTVANVTKQTALLFTMKEGKLIFARKVPAGEAVDLETMQHERWVAVFPGSVWSGEETGSGKPTGETFMPTQSKAIWLLR